MNIPFVDLKAQYRTLKSEIDAAIARTLERADFIKGEDVTKFENAFAKTIGVKHCVAVANGTDALYIALKALSIGPGDEVVTAANSFIATSEAITRVGGKPIFVDCDPKTYTIDVAQLEDTVERGLKNGRKIKAIIPVHLYGRSADMSAVMRIAQKHGLKVIEDCAQSHLAKAGDQTTGSIGDIATFSFFPGKNLGAFGDAGALVAHDDSIAHYVRMYANHGRITKYDHEFEGINSRMDTLQAAVLNVKLPHLTDWTAKRYQNAKLYIKLLEGSPYIQLPELPPEGEHVFHLFVIRSVRRDYLLKSLNAKGIAAAVHYPIALPNLQAYRWLEHQPCDFPVSTRLQTEILSLPMYPELTEEQIRFVVNAVHDCLKES